MTPVEIIGRVRAVVDPTVDVSVGPRTTIVNSGNVKPYVLVGFINPERVAAALELPRAAVRWQLRTMHVLTNKGVRNDYDGQLIIDIVPERQP